MSKIKLEVEISDGIYCKTDNTVKCRFYMESEDGDTGCSLLDDWTFIEGDISSVPKMDKCPNPDKGLKGHFVSEGVGNG